MREETRVVEAAASAQARISLTHGGVEKCLAGYEGATLSRPTILISRHAFARVNRLGKMAMTLTSAALSPLAACT